ncbi:MAG: amidohydrolase family protein, partial [Nanoarchaeota archaeon]
VIQETVAQKCSREFSPQFDAAPYYSGPLFDAHFHMPPTYDEEPEKDWRYPIWGKEITLPQILCTFDKEKVRGAITFNFWEYENLEQSIQDTAEMKKQLPIGIHLFLIPSELLAEELDEIVTSYKGVYDGFGEIVFYDPERPGATPDDPVSLEINEVAAKHGLIVMFHPGKNQRSKTENALQRNPDTKFLLHGPEAEDYITDLIKKYPNVYYSIDTILIRLPNSPGPLMYTVSGKEEYKLKFTQNFDAMLNDAVKKWKNRIEQHPDRFMWGTDRAADWHHNEEISILVEEFTRAFIGRLHADAQEKYAYQNAERMMK